jgi:hypothetical protein
MEFPYPTVNSLPEISLDLNTQFFDYQTIDIFNLLSIYYH